MKLIYDGDILTHHGIKGQRWGVRRFQPYPKNHKRGKEIGEAANYSNRQRIRDQKIYGKKAVKRIDKRMVDGEGVQSARHDEVVKKARNKKVSKFAKKALITAGAIATPLLIAKLQSQFEVKQQRAKSDAIRSTRATRLGSWKK